MPTNPNAKLFNEWGAFAVIPHEFIDVIAEPILQTVTFLPQEVWQ